MNARPLILALANPDPEILPEAVRAVRDDAIIATGRSDYPNQVNNVLCFPFIFRGALDVGASTINEAMKIACVHAIADLAKAEQSDVVAQAYGDQEMSFGADYLIPKPFDPRLIVKIAPAVAQAAMDSGVATHPITDMEAYREKLDHFVYQSGLLMKPVFTKAKASPRRIVFAEGEEEKVLRAVQIIVDEGLARPILIGRPDIIERRIEKMGLRLKEGRDLELINEHSDPRFKEYYSLYHRLMERKGVSPDFARQEVQRNTTLISALMVRRQEADGMICGTIGQYESHLRYLTNVLGLRPGAEHAAAMNVLLSARGALFICDTYVNADPSADELAGIAVMAAEQVRRFGITPKVALVSHSSFGSADTPSARKMRETLDLLRRRAPQLEVDGEMHGDAALSEELRRISMPNSRLRGAANLLIMPNLDAANIAFNLMKVVCDGITVGPILLGAAAPAHILTPSCTVRRVVNMTALAVVDAQNQRWFA